MSLAFGFMTKIFWKSSIFRKFPGKSKKFPGTLEYPEYPLLKGKGLILDVIYSDVIWALFAKVLIIVMRGTPPALQIAAENFSSVGVARSESGELSKDEHRPSKRTAARSMIFNNLWWYPIIYLLGLGAARCLLTEISFLKHSISIFSKRDFILPQLNNTIKKYCTSLLLHETSCLLGVYTQFNQCSGWCAARLAWT